MKKLFTCFNVISTIIQSQAQYPFARSKVEDYDSKNGMPKDFVMNTYQAKDGFTWMIGFIIGV